MCARETPAGSVCRFFDCRVAQRRTKDAFSGQPSCFLHFCSGRLPLTDVCGPVQLGRSPAVVAGALMALAWLPWGSGLRQGCLARPLNAGFLYMFTKGGYLQKRYACSSCCLASSLCPGRFYATIHRKLLVAMASPFCTATPTEQRLDVQLATCQARKRLELSVLNASLACRHPKRRQSELEGGRKVRLMAGKRRKSRGFCGQRWPRLSLRKRQL